MSLDSNNFCGSTSASEVEELFNLFPLPQENNKEAVPESAIVPESCDNVSPSLSDSELAEIMEKYLCALDPPRIQISEVKNKSFEDVRETVYNTVTCGYRYKLKFEPQFCQAKFVNKAWNLALIELEATENPQFNVVTQRGYLDQAGMLKFGEMKGQKVRYVSMKAASSLQIVEWKEPNVCHIGFPSGNGRRNSFFQICVQELQGGLFIYSSAAFKLEARRRGKMSNNQDDNYDDQRQSKRPRIQ